MRLATILRTIEAPQVRPFDHQHYLCDHYKKIFDDLGITLVPIFTTCNIEEVCEMCDGLVLPGSDKDIFPSYFGREPLEGKVYKVDEYAQDKKVVDYFVERNLPIIGICGGLQVLNVYFGGTLFQKIPNHYLEPEGLHTISIKEGSFLHRTYGTTTAEVNSFHNCAIEDIAPGFDVIATTEDGIIEAIEKDNIIAFQWHPEVMYDMPIFEQFVKEFLTK